MTSEEIKALLERQRSYYKSGATMPVKFRVAQLKRLYDAVRKYQGEISAALTSDLGKSDFEGFMCEKAREKICRTKTGKNALVAVLLPQLQAADPLR